MLGCMLTLTFPVSYGLRLEHIPWKSLLDLHNAVTAQTHRTSQPTESLLNSPSHVNPHVLLPRQYTLLAPPWRKGRGTFHCNNGKVMEGT